MKWFILMIYIFYDCCALYNRINSFDRQPFCSGSVFHCHEREIPFSMCVRKWKFYHLYIGNGFRKHAIWISVFCWKILLIFFAFSEMQSFFFNHGVTSCQSQIHVNFAVFFFELMVRCLFQRSQVWLVFSFLNSISLYCAMCISYFLVLHGHFSQSTDIDG